MINLLIFFPARIEELVCVWYYLQNHWSAQTSEVAAAQLSPELLHRYNRSMLGSRGQKE